jgi:uncharacterized protein YkwD
LDVFEAHNKMRTNPKSFIPTLEKMLASFSGNIMVTDKGRLMTKEGPSAVKEAIKFLKKQKPVSALRWDLVMMQAPRDHVLDQGPKG